VLKYRYEELSWPEVREVVKSDPVAVLPVGTTEQHGPHLPVMVDYACASGVAEGAVRHVVASQPQDEGPHAVVLHPVPYSFNEHHMDYPGTIDIDPHTIIDYIFCIGKSLAHHGFKRIIILNGHGSNVPFLDIAARMITNRTESIAAMVSWWAILEQEDFAWREAPYPGGFSHGCEAETSLMLQVRPDLVDMKQAPRTMDEVQRSKHIYWDLQGGSKVNFQEFFSRNSETGVQGDATLANAEKGQKLYTAAISRMAEFIEEFRMREIRPRRDFH